MIHNILLLSTNLFRAFVTKRFMEIFFQQERMGKKQKHLIYLLFFAITSSVHLIFKVPFFNIISNIVALYLVTQVYEGEQKKKLLVSLLIYGINMFCDVISAYTLSDYSMGEMYNEIAPLFTVFLISICEYIIERHIVKKHVETTPRHWNILIFIPIISAVMLGVMMLKANNHRIMMVCMGIGLLIINVLVFYLYNVITDAYGKLEEKVLYERQMASYAKQMDIWKQSEEKVNALRHDMKHHLFEIDCMAKSGDTARISGYLREMRGFMENKEEYVSSGNRGVDSILNYMLGKAEKESLVVIKKISIPKEIHISEFDLNVILGNLLENAIAAAKGSEKKYLEIQVSYEKGMLFIQIKNSYSGKLIKTNGIYQTTKTDHLSHGIGIKNVRKVVAKNKGVMEISDENGMFLVKIILF